jgi:hypothetical protein
MIARTLPTQLAGVLVLAVALAGCGSLRLDPPAPSAPIDQWRLDLTPVERGAMLQVPAFHERSEAFRQETTRLEIEPGEGMEYKYRLEPGDTVLYSWQSDLPLHVEMHSQPDDAPFRYANSLKLNDALTESHGSFTAPYPGIHGWYWENRSIDIITVTVTSAGFYRESQEFRGVQAPISRAID